MTIIMNHNGNFIDENNQAPFRGSAYLFGDSLFETMKVRDGKVLFLQEHLDRLTAGALLLGIPCSRRKLEAALLATLERSTSPVIRLRLTLARAPMSGLRFGKGQAAEFVITSQPYSEISETERQAGATCLTAPNQRVNPRSHLPQLKHGNYADCLYAWNYAQDNGAQEALFCTPDGYLLEGATSNLFIRQGNTLITPPLENLVLSGIMRSQVLRAASELGLVAKEEPITRQDLLNADEAFLSNSLIEVCPVAWWDDQHLKRGGVWKALLQQLMIFAA